MTKKDYKLLAEVLNSESSPVNDGVIVLETLMVKLCNVLKKDNPRFDEDRFYEAVYGTGKEKKNA